MVTAKRKLHHTEEGQKRARGGHLMNISSLRGYASLSTRLEDKFRRDSVLSAALATHVTSESTSRLGDGVDGMLFR